MRDDFLTSDWSDDHHELAGAMDRLVRHVATALGTIVPVRWLPPGKRRSSEPAAKLAPMRISRKGLAVGEPATLVPHAAAVQIGDEHA